MGRWLLAGAVLTPNMVDNAYAQNDWSLTKLSTVLGSGNVV
jgi:hypothetical protein